MFKALLKHSYTSLTQKVSIKFAKLSHRHIAYHIMYSKTSQIDWGLNSFAYLNLILNYQTQYQELKSYHNSFQKWISIPQLSVLTRSKSLPKCTKRENNISSKLSIMKWNIVRLMTTTTASAKRDGNFHGNRSEQLPAAG